MTTWKRWILAGALALPLSARAADPTVTELLNAADDVQRGDHSHAVIEMDVTTDRYERAIRIEAWADGTDKTLIRILSPAKDAGVATLRDGPNIWNYLPKVDRTMKLPAGMMGGSWMGSHFTNDDLVKSSRMADDYTASIVSSPGKGGPDWVLELIPHPDAPVVWGKVTIEISPAKVPVEAKYYDEKGTLVRTFTWTDVQPIDGRQVPMTITLLPADKPGESTRITYEKLEFNTDIPASMFTLQALK